MPTYFCSAERDASRTTCKTTIEAADWRDVAIKFAEWRLRRDPRLAAEIARHADDPVTFDCFARDEGTGREALVWASRASAGAPWTPFVRTEFAVQGLWPPSSTAMSHVCFAEDAEDAAGAALHAAFRKGSFSLLTIQSDWRVTSNETGKETIIRLSPDLRLRAEEVPSEAP